jgi:hypothetical protein
MVLAAGCGKGSLKTTTVRVKVYLGAKPLTKGSVNFYPDSSKGNATKEMAVASINEAGEYTLGTKAQTGATPGWYKVTVTSNRPSNPRDEYSVPVSLVPKVYNSDKTTPLSIEVKESAPEGHYDLKLTR